jgi:hypothetical protein
MKHLRKRQKQAGILRPQQKTIKKPETGLLDGP